MNDCQNLAAGGTSGGIKPRVAWVVHRFTSGGIGPVCIYAARELARQFGWQTTVVGLHEPVDWESDPIGHARMTPLALPEQDTSGFLEWLRANPQDIIITNDVDTLSGFMPYLPLETAHVIQVHDSGARYIASTARNTAFADAVICVAEHFVPKVRNAVKSSGFAGPVRAIHNGADFPTVPARTHHHRPLRLLYMGRMDPLVKGTFDLAGILAAVVDLGIECSLTIAGGECGRLKTRMKNRGLAERVEWLGRIPHAECYTLAATSDVFMMTSRKEPFGMVTIEAMAMGCVPIAWDIDSGTREIVIDGECGLLVPIGSARRFAKAIAGLDRDRHLLNRMSNAASERARSRFSASHMASELENFLMKSPRNPSRVARTGIPSPVASSPPRQAAATRSDGLRALARAFLEDHPRAATWALKHII